MGEIPLIETTTLQKRRQCEQTTEAFSGQRLQDACEARRVLDTHGKAEEKTADYPAIDASTDGRAAPEG